MSTYLNRKSLVGCLFAVGLMGGLSSVALAVVVLGVVLLGGRIEVGYADAPASVGPLEVEKS